MSFKRQRMCVLIGLAMALGVFSLAIAADVLSDLGVSVRDANDKFFYAFTDSSIAFPDNARSPKAIFKGASPQNRALMVNAVCALAKTYTQSDEFKRRYAEFRRANRPEAAGSQPDAESRKQMEKEIKEAEAELKTLPPEMRKQFQETIAEMRAALDPYGQEMKEFEAEYPEDPNALVSMRLKEFLTLTASIDFNARLVDTRFADPALESKPNQWKACYRAGREATEAARAFAAQWLKELGR